MNKFKRVILAPLAASGALLALMSPMAHAVDGIVNFSGNITDVSCDINGQAPGAGNVTNVDLGIVAPTHFTAVGTSTTFKEFQLVLSGAGCADDRKVSIAFDPVTNIDRNTGNLTLMGPAEAKGVQIQIFNNSATSTTKIPLGSVEASPQKATITKNTATLMYKASYVSTEKTVTAGTGLSHIRYVLAYQ
ncbi:fimbrial protein [Pseudomonas aeruginosa]|uniref:fimbrial protein n=1 Tax=Pseudomonas aeruginosa TaxID=287 RepID=UPI000EAFDD97|nr:fimbrial protein [Pseudomonas aeruginosa]MBH8872943.1 type 1 fimbrial protein [Pseudomonas aeruginosa]